MTMTTSPARKIIEDFAREIEQRKTSTAKPSRTVIDFRQEKSDAVERDIFNVPLDLLRFRKDNGRIASDVLSYEKSDGPLVETEKQAQKKVDEFLSSKDPEKTSELSQLIYANGQDNAAIITCDGFLIDGNRRRLVLGLLSKRYPSDPRFQTMKVVILPGANDEGGPPTLLEIEKIENRYQLQSDGKAAYYGFDAALSIRQKEERGFPLEDQLRDDPQYRALEDREFNKVVKKKRQELLEPLECVDRYLEQFDRPGLYSAISKGLGDKTGRWQAFIDYSSFYSGYLQNDSKRQQIGIDETEVGDIEDAAFKIIRLRDLSGIAKVHDVIRKLSKICSHAKKEILAISKKVADDIPKADKFDVEGTLRPLADQDQMWAAKGKQEIIHHVKKAMFLSTSRQEKETPLTLLKAALKKLQHEDMDISVIALNDYDVARKLVSEIQNEAKELEHSIYEAQKKTKHLTTGK